MKSYPLILTLFAALMTGCRSSSPEWGEPVTAPPGSFLRTWAVDTTIEDPQAFYFVNDMLFVYGENNVVAAFDANGGLQFRITVGTQGDVVDMPIVQADRVIFPTNSTLEVYSRQGILRRSIALDMPIRSPAIAIDQTVYAGVDSVQGGRIAAIGLDRPYNPIRWTRMARGVVQTQPALFENVIYFANEVGEVISVTNDPTLLWARTEEMPEAIFKTAGKIQGAIRVDEGGVYVPSTDTKFYALDPTTGKIRWEYFAGVPVLESATPTTDSVYIHIDGKGLLAFDKKQANRYAQPRWTNTDAVTVLADDAKLVYVLTKSGTIAALDKKTGKEQFATNRSDFAYTVQHINPKNNTLFVVTNENQLVAIEPVSRAGAVGILVSGEPKPANETPAIETPSPKIIAMK